MSAATKAAGPKKVLSTEDIQYKLDYLRRNTTYVIQNSWKEVEDLKSQSSKYDEKLKQLQSKLDAIQTIRSTSEEENKKDEATNDLTVGDSKNVTSSSSAPGIASSGASGSMLDLPSLVVSSGPTAALPIKKPNESDKKEDKASSLQPQSPTLKTPSSAQTPAGGTHATPSSSTSTTGNNKNDMNEFQQNITNIFNIFQQDKDRNHSQQHNDDMSSNQFLLGGDNMSQEDLMNQQDVSHNVHDTLSQILIDIAPKSKQPPPVATPVNRRSSMSRLHSDSSSSLLSTRSRELSTMSSLRSLEANKGKNASSNSSVNSASFSNRRMSMGDLSLKSQDSMNGPRLSDVGINAEKDSFFSVRSAVSESSIAEEQEKDHEKEDDEMEKNDRMDHYSYIEGVQFGQKLVDKLEARLKSTNDNLENLDNVIEEQETTIKNLKQEIYSLYSTFQKDSNQLHKECIDVQNQITSFYDVKAASLEHECLELESELECRRAHEKLLSQELANLNARVNKKEMLDRMDLAKLKQKLHEMNIERSQKEKEVDKMKKQTTQIFAKLRRGFDHAIPKPPPQAASDDASHHSGSTYSRYDVENEFMKAYNALKTKEIELARHFSNRLNFRRETDETLQGIISVKRELTACASSLKEINFNVSESLIFLVSHNVTKNKQGVATVRSSERVVTVQDVNSDCADLLSFQPSIRFHKLATSSLETSLHCINQILTSLMSVEEELQKQLTLLGTMKFKTISSDAKAILTRATNQTKTAIASLDGIEETMTKQLRALEEEEIFSQRRSSLAATTDSSTTTSSETLKVSPQEEIIEDFEAELEFENAKLIALKRRTNQDEQMVDNLQLDYSNLQSRALEEFKFHLMTLESIQNKVDRLKNTLSSNVERISNFESNLQTLLEEESVLKKEFEEIKAKAKRRAPCVPMDLSHTVM